MKNQIENKSLLI